MHVETHTITASGQSAVFGVRTVASLGVYLNLGTSGTFVFEATLDEDTDSATWFAIDDDLGGAGSATAEGAYFFSNPGYSYIRFRCTALNGDATIKGMRGYASLRSTASLAGESQGDGAIQDGANSAIEATVLDLTNANPLVTAIVDADGTHITSFGGGTQYATGDAQATPTGTVALGTDGTNVLALRTDATGNLQVEFPSAQSVNAAQSGTWDIRIQDGAGNDLTSKSVGSERALSVAVVDGSGNQITSFGGAEGSGGLAEPTSDTHSYDATATDTAVDVSDVGYSKWALQVKGTGAAATSWTAVLQVSLDGTNFSTILTHTDSTDDDGSIVAIGTPFPALHYRTSVTALTLGSASAISVTAVGMQ